MVPLAKASAVLKISREELIGRLSTGELRGEKRRIGESKRDSWFIYADQFDRLMAQAVAKYEDRVNVKGLDKLFSTENGIPSNRTAAKTATAGQQSAPAQSAAAPKVVSETIAIAPVAANHNDIDPSEIVDALGINYALGSDYGQDDHELCDTQTTDLSRTAPLNSFDAAKINNGSIGQAMVAQLMQHLQEEHKNGETIKARLALLEEEVEHLRQELLSRPDKLSHSPIYRLKSYLRLWLGTSR